MRPLRVLGLTALVLHLGCSTLPAPDRRAAASIHVVTQTPIAAAQAPQPDRLDPDARYPAGSRIVLVSASGGSADIGVLSGDLHAAGAPAVSPDAERVLFAGRRAADTPWAIYEVRIARSRPRKVMDTGNDCIDPAYLPAGRIVFTCREAGATPSGASTWSLYTAAQDGSDLRRVTFGPGAAFDPTVLRDGRVLFSMRRAQDASAALFTVNPDGTLLDEFVGNHERKHELRPRATADGGVLFIAAQVEFESQIERVELGYPSTSRRQLPVTGASMSSRLVDPLSAEPLPDGQILFAARAARSPSWGIFRAREDERYAEPVLDTAEWHEVEAVPLVGRVAPRGRPSIIDPSVPNGALVCYDTQRTDGRIGPAETAPRAVTVSIHSRGVMATGEHEILLGRLPVEPDGSFFVEVPADTPLRVVSFDEQGAQIAASGWFWVRPGEVRACFGCHEGRDSAPINRTIAALSSDPVRVGLDEVRP